MKKYRTAPCICTLKNICRNEIMTNKKLNKKEGINMIELGISSLGKLHLWEGTGKVLSHDERIRNMIEEIELADKAGLDIYAIGEHHRKDFAVSVLEIVLAAGAVNTKNIRLSSANDEYFYKRPCKGIPEFCNC